MVTKRFGVVWLLTLALGGAFLARWLGWIDGVGLVDLLVGAGALAGLLGVLWLPWDLYFAARSVRVDQRESALRGIAVPPEDRVAADALPRRLLALAIGLHLVGAALVALVTWMTGGRLGYGFAGCFLVAMGFRPVGALYVHLRARLRDLAERARYPREDVLTLRDEVARALTRIEALDAAELPALRADDEALRAELHERDDAARCREARFEQKVDQVLSELERSVSRLTQDQELLRGVRAFVRLVKAS